MLRDSVFFEQWMLLELVTGVESSMPLLDESVVNFSLSLPNAFYQSKSIDAMDLENDNALNKRVFFREMCRG